MPGILLLAMAACTSPNLPASTQPVIPSPTHAATEISSTPSPTSTFTPTPDPASSVIQLRDALPADSCDLPTIAVPTAAPEPQALNGVDPSTGLHMTGKPLTLALDPYRLLVTGKVDNPLNLSYDDLRCMPKVESNAELVCPRVFRDVATWAGTPLAYVLGLAGIQPDATTLHLVSADGYSTDVSLEKALAANGFLAYEWEGEPLPILHGFPLRAVFPGLEGNKWVKWLVQIEVQ